MYTLSQLDGFESVLCKEKRSYNTAIAKNIYTGETNPKPCPKHFEKDSFIKLLVMFQEVH